jgi:DNA gyrase subunit B
MAEINEYGAESIKVLEGLDGVRRRPSMYIGSTGKDGLHHLVYEVVDNSVDEALAGFCDIVIISLNKDGSVTVIDNGRGIPVEKHSVYKKSAMEIALTKLHAGGKFDKHTYEISGGLHGVGVSVVNALSIKMIAVVKRDGNIYQQEYKIGVPQHDVKTIGKTDKKDTGTSITFYPDSEIFSTLEFDFAVLKKRLQEIAFLNPNLKIILKDEKNGKEETFHYTGGLIEFVSHINKSKSVLHKPVYFKKQVDSNIVEVALQYNDGYNENIFGFVNTINTTEGGTHISGFKTALTRAINDYSEKKGMLKNEKLTGDDAREGLTAIISLKMREPQFEGQTKTKLGNSEIKGIVDSMVYVALTEFLEENPNVSNKISQKVVASAKAREAAKKARDLVRRKNVMGGLSGLPGKLADCSSRKVERTEMYIVEGDSAAGCFSGDTKVALADGRNLSFADIIKEHQNGKKNFTFTFDRGLIKTAEIKNPRKTIESAEIMKVLLDNGEEIKCTLNHKFMLRDGSYKEAKYLQSGNSLMPLYADLLKNNINNNLLLCEIDKNHKVVNIEFLNEFIDVYDLEVKNTHNFALASGVFVHNSSKMAREKEFQAILPLKGKILNVEKSNPTKVLTSDEIVNLITAIGTGVKENFDIAKLRYGKIIAMCDADVDGQHITTLLLTFFYRYMPELIENGNVYIAVSPLYRVRKKKDYYVYSDDELKKTLDKLGGGKADVQRFKGLGEMNPSQLWDTTMDPKKRILKKVTIEDAVLADQTFSMLMGDEVGPRRKFIEVNANIAEVDI